MPKSWALGAAIAVSILSSFVATAVEPPDEYAKLIREHSRIGTLDGGFFGDHVGLSTGALAFTQTDVSLPGNDSLAVRVGRRFGPGSWPARGHFADWDLDIPHLHGVFGGSLPTNVRWEVNATAADHRCSEFSAPPEISTVPPNSGVFSPDEYWQGTFFYLPGSGDQELLHGGDAPTSGGPYYVSTREGAAARCLSSLAATSEAGSTGEGFEVVTPDGTIYRFDQMVSRYADDLYKSDPLPLLRASGRDRKAVSSSRLPGDAQGSGSSTNAVECCTMKRREFFLYPTKVTDRFGNTVTYTWDSSNPWRLLHVTGSDGRQIDFTYPSSDPDSILVQSVSDGTHAWTYTYAGTVPDVHLVTVTQPDQNTWAFDLLDLYRDAKPHPYGATCDTLDFTPASWTGTITAPSGATARYTVAPKLFGRSWVFRDCKLPTGQPEYVAEPYLFVGIAITGKTITGPGLPSAGLAWTYAYGLPNNCWNPSGVPGGDPDAVICTSPVSRTTIVTEPDGAVSRYTFGNKVGTLTQSGNEGLLQSEEHGVSGGTALRTTAYAYGESDAAPYGSLQGSSLRRRGDWSITGQRRPRLSAITTLQGKTFSWSVPQACGGNFCFDSRARPLAMVRAGVNTPVGNQTETIAYDDDTANWILGQVASRTIDGIVAAQTTFDANHMPWKVYAFGKPASTFTYDTASAVATGQRGTLLAVADGAGNTTSYSSWKRGIPQSVHFPATPEAPAGATRSAVVNAFGWITAVTDENGFATSYSYDTMGRITQVTSPASDSTAWNSTASVFEPVASAEHGLAAGHWRETVSMGNARKITLFDALWRPLLVREYDTANPAGTDRYVATAYDKAGRVSDTAYPLDTAGSGLTLTGSATWQFGSGRPDGVRTSYDALGRPTLVQQDSELGVLATATAYLGDFKRKTTDARNNATTEQFMAWDTPTFDWPVQIDAPEGQRTVITRDVFGKPTSIIRQEVGP